MKNCIVDISSVCYNACKYCLHQYNKLCKHAFMDNYLFEKIINILHKEGYKHIWMYMSGEPLLHKSFWEFLSIANNLGIDVTVATKLNLNESYFNDIKDAFNKQSKIIFEITIDASTQEIQNKIADKININQVYKNLNFLMNNDILKKYITFRLITVKTRHNENDIENIKEKVKGLKFSEHVIKQMGFFLGVNYDRATVETIRDLRCLDNQRFKIENCKVISKTKKCYSLTPAISPDGFVTICCHDMLYHEAKQNILKTNSLDAILNSVEYKEQQRKGNDRSLDICKNCN